MTHRVVLERASARPTPEEASSEGRDRVGEFTSSDVGIRTAHPRHGVLVTWGSTHGGTEGIARMVAARLGERGHSVTLAPAHSVRSVDTYEAVLVGGALYANRWHPEARRFVQHHIHALQQVPVWLFSSGPLDDSASLRDIPPTEQVEVLMDRIGALGHATFGGSLSADVKGFPAAAMAKEHAGDWRDEEKIRAWADDVADWLPVAEPRPGVEPPGRSLARWAGYAVAAWISVALPWLGLAALLPTWADRLVHGLLVLLVYAGVSFAYFSVRGPREAWPTASGFAVVAAALDVLVLWAFGVGVVALGGWLDLLVPYALVFLVTGVIGAVLAMKPWEFPKEPA